MLRNPGIRTVIKLGKVMLEAKETLCITDLQRRMGVSYVYARWLIDYLIRRDILKKNKPTKKVFIMPGKRYNLLTHLVYEWDNGVDEDGTDKEAEE